MRCFTKIKPSGKIPEFTVVGNIFICLFDLILYDPVNNFSVMLGWVFLGWTSTKQGLMCLAQGHNTLTPVRLNPRHFCLQSSALPLSHCTPYIQHIIIHNNSWLLFTWKSTGTRTVRIWPRAPHNALQWKGDRQLVAILVIAHWTKPIFKHEWEIDKRRPYIKFWKNQLINDCFINC